MTDIEKKNKPAELKDDELEMISGGEYGDLLRPTMITYHAICACGYQENVSSARYGKVVCQQCGQLITNYEAAGCSR